jgi:hypothetical protein
MQVQEQKTVVEESLPQSVAPPSEVRGFKGKRSQTISEWIS